MKYKEQRVGVFVDTANMYYSARYLFEGKVNFKKVLELAVEDRKLIRARAYVVRSQSEEEAAFFTALDKQGYEVEMKDLQVFAGGQKKGDWDVGIAVDAIRMSTGLDVIVLVSGDGDYLPLVEYLQNRGKLVEVVAFGESCALKLKERADTFTDLSEHKGKIIIPSGGRPRPVRRNPAGA
ncbi:MAG: NYN domain-containing protein [Candidatus Kerfeldbacteria bacterium]|nr:NYN domain-containing protein [Candidatus Kerfeldbacteria bacterium]